MPTVNKNFRVKNGIDAEGTITGTALAITGGTASQFLKADGTVDSSTYLTTGTASSTYLPLAGGTLTGQLISTRSWNATDNLGQIYLNGTTGNRIDFANTGINPPAFTTRSNGTKLVLFPNIQAAAVDYALGIESSNLWFSTPNSGTGFKWYGGQTNIMTLRGDGTLSLNSTSLTLGNGGTANNTSHQFGVVSGAAANIVQVIRGTTSQTGNLTQWQDVNGAILASMSASGNFVAVTKSFDIPHPTKENMRLRYGSLEGPENGVYVRGKSTKKTIKIPDYWKGLVDKDSITVQLTSIGSGTIYVDSIKGNSIKVGGTSEEFFYLIQAERKDVDKLIVEY